MEKLKIRDQIIFLYCSDLRRTARFYEDLLDFQLVVDQGSCRIVKVAGGGGGDLGYCERLTGENALRGVILTFVVDTNEEVDAWYAQLFECEVELSDSPRFNPDYGIYHFFFNDPDGFKLEIQAFQDPKWSDPL